MTVLKRGSLQLESDSKFARAGTTFVPLPSDMQVLDREGSPVPATGEFWVSVDTIDPHHVLIDVFAPNPLE